jgi:hypothetical protein
MGYREFYRARDVIKDILAKDLIGPVSENETIGELPTSYYVAAKLYPQNIELSCDSDGRLELDDAAGSYDASVSLSNQKKPSSCALTFAINGNVAVLNFEISFALYENVVKAGHDDDLRLRDERWTRRPHEYHFEWECSDGGTRFDMDGIASLRVISRTGIESKNKIVTVALVNEYRGGSSKIEQSEHTLFQPEIRVSMDVVEEGFLDIDMRDARFIDSDTLEMELLYHDSICYAQGHGCSVCWESTTGKAPHWVGTTFLPYVRNRQMMPQTFGETDLFKMKHLVETDPQVLRNEFIDFINKYDSWIDAQACLIDALDSSLVVQAESNLEECRRSSARLENSIELLFSDENALRAFRLANEAMLLQREWLYNAPADEAEWYPFQLAFLIQEISSFIQPNGQERAVADLLWFPTGGGKTEAYLGIAAFAIFLRRLRRSDDDGVTVIMRYTLRLLTIQQFERASSMIVACEHLRRKYALGGSEISIGLWVGKHLTPNNLSEAETALSGSDENSRYEPTKSNPIQVTKCPKCGAEIGVEQYSIDPQTGRMVIRCSNEDCEFHYGLGLPIHIVDECIYRYAPTFIVATVDKFAQVPLNGNTSALFGISNGKNPPDLIIQDELHLISGPLGTMVGIYEAAIGRLCERGGYGPKVIASTATVRNAKSQLAALYGRDYFQFPPQGVDIRDSFFAIEADSDQKPDRMYVGLMGVDSTQTTTLIRVYGALLFATRYLAIAEYPDEVVDSYWTIVGYFSTLRELGGTLTLIYDAIQQRFGFLAGSKFAKLYPGVDPELTNDHTLELTSRKANSEIVEALDRLATPYAAENHVDTLDFALATNMISVGVDVSRLGCMVVDNQPKSNSEYIQATSRVGRSNPGLVVTVYNDLRSRDRSHYEQFVRYHSSLYRYVESTSVTPFSDRARDRGLHVVFVTLCRYLLDGLSENDGANKFRSDMDGVQEIKDYIVRRIALVDMDEAEAASKELDDIASRWDDLAGGSLVYKAHPNASENALLGFNDEEMGFKVMNSMRNVEPMSNVFISK